MSTRTTSLKPPSQQTTDNAPAYTLEGVLHLASAGRLDDKTRSALWALVAAGRIEDKTAHALVTIDTAERKRKPRPSRKGNSRRAAVRRRWAKAVPVVLREDGPDLPRATWAVLGVLIDRASLYGDEWRCEISMTELQSRLCRAGRETVVLALKAFGELPFRARDSKLGSRAWSARHQCLRSRPPADRGCRCGASGRAR